MMPIAGMFRIAVLPLYLGFHSSDHGFFIVYGFSETRSFRQEIPVV